MKITQTKSCNTKNLGKFDAGLCNISNSTHLDSLELLLPLGFHREKGMYVRRSENLSIYVNIQNNKVAVECKDRNNSRIEYKKFQNEEQAALHILDILEDYNIDIFSSIVIFDKNLPIYDVAAAITSKTLADKLLRVKSSNIWSYGMDIKNYGDRVGNLLIQFKGTDGGPDDIYQYFDVPVKLWNKFITAPSKGHFFWKYIRNAFKYRKLTGDKRGKLPNAIN